MAFPYTRTKKLTDSSYSPDFPTTPRQDIDGAIQEVYDMLSNITSGTSGAENIGSSTISGITGNTLHAQISNLKTQLNNIILNQIPDESLTEAKFEQTLQDKINRASRMSKLYAYKNIGGAL